MGREALLSWQVCDTTRTPAGESKASNISKMHVGRPLRRLLTICSIAGLAVAAITAAWKAAPAHAANRPAPQAVTASTSQNPSATRRQASAAATSKPLVIATNVETRALAVEDQQALYLTAATAPNRVFTLGNFANDKIARLQDESAATNPSPSISSSATTNPFASVIDALNPVAKLLPFAGSGQTGSLGDEGTALLAQFNFKTDSPVMRSGVAVAPDGTMFIADTMNATIRRISGPNCAQPGIITSVVGKWADVPTKDGARSNVMLDQPMGLALDRSGNLYIADYAAGAVDELPAATSDTPGALQILAHVMSPGAVAVTPDGRRVYVASAETGFVTSIDTATLAIRPVMALRPPSAPATGAATSCSAQEENGSAGDCAAGLAVDGRGNLFAADLMRGQIARVDANTGAQKIVAAGLLSPGDMAFDNKGNLFLSEQGRAQVVEFVAMGAPVSNLAFTAPAALPPPTPPQVCTALVAQPSAFNFCDAPIGGSTSTLTWALTNNTTSQVSGLAVAMNPALTPPNFTIIGTTCGPTLAAGASCNVQVQFTPQAAGELDAALTATDEQGDTGTSEVGGTGMDFQLALGSGQSTQLNVNQGGSVTFNLQVMPDSTFADAVTFACPPPAPRGIMVNGDVPPFTSCTISPASATVTPGTPVPFTVTFQTTLNFIPPPQAMVVGGGHGPQSGAGDASGAPFDHIARRALFPALGLAALLGLIALMVALAAMVANFWIARHERARLAESSPDEQAARSLRIARPARFARWRHVFAAAAAFAMIGGLAALSACHHAAPNPAIETTPVGTTTMNIRGTTQGASRGVSITLQVIAPPPGP